MPDFGFVGASYQAPSIYQDAQECINWYPEVDPMKGQGERGVVSLYPTPGLLNLLQLPNIDQIRGIHVFPGGQFLYVACGNVFYKIDPQFNVTLIGTLNTSVGLVSIKDNGTSLYLCDGPNRYAVSGGVLSVISDGAFNGADRVDEVDGFFIYNSPGTNQWGCSNNLSTASNALNLSSKDGSSDNIVSLIVVNREVFLLGEQTSEVWINVGSFPFPFQRIPGASMQHGCIAAQSVARLGESFAFLAKDTRGTATVVMMQGYTPLRLSTHAMENELNQYQTISDAVGYTYQQSGHEFYVLTFPSADKTWVFDLATQLWHKRAYRDSANILHRHRGNCCAFFANYHVVGDYQNGILYALSNNSYTENGNSMIRLRRCPHILDDLKRVFHHELQLQFQPGVGLGQGQGSDPNIMLRWSDDGGSTWTKYYTTSIGKQGFYKNRAIFRRLGQARDRVYEVTITDPVFSPIISANLIISQANH